MTLAVLAAAVAVVSVGAGGKTPGEPTCRAPETRVHDEVVFGHFSTNAAASALRKRAAKLRYKGIKIENEGCSDFEVEIDGADMQQQRSSFAREAAKSGFAITFEQQAPPMAFQQGQVVGILGRLPTLAQANALMGRLARQSFRYIDVVPSGSRWLVIMPQVPVKSALSITKEVTAAGFHVQFRPGARS